MPTALALCVALHVPQQLSCSSGFITVQSCTARKILSSFSLLEGSKWTCIIHAGSPGAPFGELSFHFIAVARSIFRESFSGAIRQITRIRSSSSRKCCLKLPESSLSFLATCLRCGQMLLKNSGDIFYRLSHFSCLALLGCFDYQHFSAPQLSDNLLISRAFFAAYFNWFFF